MKERSSIPASLEEILHQRHSVRGFLPDPVSRATIAELLTLSRLAPSGANLQPGEFHVLTGKALSALVNTLDAAIDAGKPEVAEYSYFPAPMPAALKARQHAAGFALYKALGITRRDTQARRDQFRRNYRFFDAPVGIVVSIQRDMGKGGFMDLGMTLMSLFLAAEARGLGASGIGALAKHADVVHDALELAPSDMVVCGIALGKPDPDSAVNECRTEREQLDNYSSFHGFED